MVLTNFISWHVANSIFKPRYYFPLSNNQPLFPVFHKISESRTASFQSSDDLLKHEYTHIPLFYSFGLFEEHPLPIGPTRVLDIS